MNVPDLDLIGSSIRVPARPHHHLTTFCLSGAVQGIDSSVLLCFIINKSFCSICAATAGLWLESVVL
ncbi:hypothetical protein N7495_009647 [Penicillium taxi]|uniref:uncharacterized protein n=1 Tax=Penicillium taxi TaxID=168475 RepID=UPI002545284D|nr:uncharacterized protein N7495_009647 [Penicillium taxi]KAJ5885137.1 hypothetical protein N7495_009647 [Penicillium taxi]